MSKGLLASLAVLLAGAGSALAQSLAPPIAANGQVPTGNGQAPASVVVPGEGLHLDGCDCDHLCDDCCCCPQTWYRGEYLLWWTKGSPTPVPMVTSVFPGTPTGGSPTPGAIGGAGTSLLIGGGDDAELGARSGGRFTIGHWFDKCETVGLEGNFFFLEAVTDSQTANSPGGAGSPILFVPFFDVTGTFTGGTPGPSAVQTALGQLFAVPNGLVGPFVSHDVLNISSQTLGAELNGVFNLRKNGRMRVDGLAGFRYLYLNEDLDLTTNTQTVAPQTSITYNTFDSFHASNNFYGGQIGVRVQVDPDDGRGGWLGGVCFRGAVKLALGGTVEGIGINGSTTTNLGNPLLPSPTNFIGGIFAQPSNIGGYEHDHFAVVPEVDLNIGYAVTRWVRVFLGYDFLYISDVARPGAQMDGGVNLYRSGLAMASGIAPPATNPARPAFSADQSSFWAQGLNVGVDVRF